MGFFDKILLFFVCNYSEYFCHFRTPLTQYSVLPIPIVSALPAQPQPFMSTQISFSKVHGQNIKLADQSATWVPRHSNGWVHSARALEPGKGVTARISGSGHCDVGFVKDDPNSTGKCLPFKQLNEVHIHKRSCEILVLLSTGRNEISSRYNDRTYRKSISRGNKVWPTCCVKFGTISIEIILNGTENEERQNLSDNHGSNIRLEDNNLRACSIKKNPASLCFLESKLSVGQKIMLKCKPLTDGQKTPSRFDLKLQVWFTNPETLKTDFRYLFDTTAEYTCEPPLTTVELLERDDCNGDISLFLDHSMMLHYTTASNKSNKQRLPSSFKDGLWIVLELYRVTVTAVNEASYTRSIDVLDSHMNEPSNINAENSLEASAGSSFMCSSDPLQEHIYSDVDEDDKSSYHPQSLHYRVQRLEQDVRRGFRSIECHIQKMSLSMLPASPHFCVTTPCVPPGDEQIIDVRRNYVSLVHGMRAVELLDYLFQEKVISRNEMEVVRNIGESAEGNRKLLDLLDKKKIRKSTMERILKGAEQGHLLDLLFPFR